MSIYNQQVVSTWAVYTVCGVESEAMVSSDNRKITAVAMVFSTLPCLDPEVICAWNLFP